MLVGSKEAVQFRAQPLRWRFPLNNLARAMALQDLSEGKRSLRAALEANGVSFHLDAEVGQGSLPKW